MGSQDRIRRRDGSVYHHDYDEAKSEWCVNCRSLGDGKRIWQFPVE